jgi:oligo-1,6-glucosidase
MTDIPWWKQKIIYQIYPMSFCDSNGDGIGDLPGIISRLDYLQRLGVGALWLSPVYPSPNKDNGYDISDYCEIHPNYGTLADMDRLIAEAKKRDIRIIMDLVINHTSDRHEWFQKSRRREEPYTDLYIWRKGEKGKKPTNWGSFFGEDCWEYDEVRGEYYLHLFAKEQPDLNYHNEKVIAAIEDVMRFWLDRGVAGFRCDVINIIYKEAIKNGRWRPALTGCEYYLSTPGCHRVLHRLNRDVLSRYDAFTVGETVFVTPKMADDLVNPQREELCTVFSFEHMETDCFKIKWFLRKFKPDRFFACLTKWQNALPWNTVYFENHDQPRSVSRYGNDAEYHDQSAKALATLLLTLRGTPFLYEGEEIGMTNFDFPDMEKVRDVESINIWNMGKRLHLPYGLRWRMIKTKSRDNARTPMQWDDSINGGFSAGTPWLSVNGNYPRINVKRQEDDPGSVLSYYRQLIAFRNGSRVLQEGDFTELYRKNGVYAYRRACDGETLTVVISLAEGERKNPASGEVVCSNYGRETAPARLAPYEALVLREVVRR